MYLMATGEPPFRDREYDRDLVCDILNGLRPPMPDSAPEEYKKLAACCCDSDPDKRPDAYPLWTNIDSFIKEAKKDIPDNSIWDTIYNNDVKALSRLEK